MDDERVRVRTELVLAVWPESVSDMSKAASGYIVEYEDGHWEFSLGGHGTVRGHRNDDERAIIDLINQVWRR